jgi:hypothetical protein
LGPETYREPGQASVARQKHDEAKSAIESCKRDGSVLEEKLQAVQAIDLERRFQWLSTKTLMPKRSKNLFEGHPWLFGDFSPVQRIWIYHLVSLIANEIRRRDRGDNAFSHTLAAMNNAANPARND